MSLTSLGLGAPEAPSPDELEAGPADALGLLVADQRPLPARRSTFGLSAVVHAAIVLLLIRIGSERAAAPEPHVPSAANAAHKVFLPPARVLRALEPPVRPRTAVPPTPKARDRISIGPPVAVRQQGPLELHRDDDLTRVTRGRTDGAPQVTATPAPPEVKSSSSSAPAQDAEAARLARELGSASDEARTARGREAAEGPSPWRRAAPSGGAPPVGPGPITSALRRMASDPGAAQPLGLPTGSGNQMGPFFFDPEGADFTAWMNHFKNEVYRNWILPPIAQLGPRGEVGLAFVVERDGTLHSVELLSSSGVPAYDRAAHNALTGSRPLPLPADFRPPRVVIQVTFLYRY